jgi:hypothetical protein
MMAATHGKQGWNPFAVQSYRAVTHLTASSTSMRLRSSLCRCTHTDTEFVPRLPVSQTLLCAFHRLENWWACASLQTYWWACAKNWWACASVQTYLFCRSLLLSAPTQQVSLQAGQALAHDCFDMRHLVRLQQASMKAYSYMWSWSVPSP